MPGGTGQTEMQAATIQALRITGFGGTPSFLKLIVEKADELKADISSLRKAIVGAEYLPPALRQAFGARGIRVLQLYATADIGLLAYESAMPDGKVNEGGLFEAPGLALPFATSAGPATLAVRPENIVTASSGEGLAGTVAEIAYHGLDRVLHVKTSASPTPLQVRVPANGTAAHKIGDALSLKIEPVKSRLFK